MATSTSAASTATGAPNQGGVLEGLNPSEYHSSNPLTLFIIQVTIIIVACRLLHWPLSKLRQPRVIAEVIGGIVLGPTVMGRIPGFRDAIFPTASMPHLSLVANLGLVLFLFLIGLEVDMRLLRANVKIALTVGAAGMLLPFGLGSAIAYGLYHQFRTDEGTSHISFGIYLLFIGVAMAITAFPVLARILTELKLLQTNVGTIVLSAGVGNDVVGWILLALTVALVNAGSGLTALYILIVAIAWVFFLVYAVRPVFLWILRRSGSLENGPTQSMVALTLLMVLASAFFTDIIGVHAIFGGFLIGLICPHEGGFAVRLTEMIEDLVSVLFLPLYFALSGLRTDIGLLNDGIVWGYVIGVIAVAFFGKIAGGTLAARFNGLLWRESFTIGVLMSCKGLVELIVLNIGLQAGIISTRVFTIFVVMALVTTFATTPLTSLLYPLWYQKKLEAWRRGVIDWDDNQLLPDDAEKSADSETEVKDEAPRISRVTVLLRLENLASIFAFVDLLSGERPAPVPKIHKAKIASAAIKEEAGTSDRTTIKQRPLEVHGVRILGLTERTSMVMQVSEVDELQERDPVLNTFKTFGRFLNLAVSAGISVAPEDSFAEVLTNKALDKASDLLLIPWTETGAVSDPQDPQNANFENRFTSHQHNQFISSALASTTCSTAIMVNRGFGGSTSEKSLSRAVSYHSIRSRKGADILATMSPISDPSHHIFFPFFGGSDDILALRFVLQLAANVNITATIIHIVYKESGREEPKVELPAPAQITSSSRRDIPRSLSTSNVPVISRDELLLVSQNTGINSDVALDMNTTFFQSMADSLPRELRERIVFETAETSKPLHYAIIRAREEVGQSPRNAGDMVIVGRGHRFHRPHIRQELITILASLETPSGAGAEARKCLGDVAEAVIVAGIKASVLVLQAGGKALERTEEAQAHIKDAQKNAKIEKGVMDAYVKE